jgi:hypothetical protein
MARIQINKQNPDADGMTVVFGAVSAAAAPDGNYFLTDGSETILIQNEGGSSITMTVDVAVAVDGVAQIKPDRVDTLASMVDLKTVLKGVDPNNPAAIDAAIKAAVDAKVAEFPEWKGTALPASSGGDRSGVETATLDERIAAASKAGNWREAIALKRQKARQTGAR